MMTVRNRFPIHPDQVAARTILRTVGPLVALAGLVLMVVGFGSFFISFGTFEPPRYFWCAFVGMPVLMVGVVLSKFAYLGAIVRYTAAETAPVARDTVNYLAHGTAPAAETLAQAVGRGYATGFGLREPAEAVTCPKCQAGNPPGSRYCNRCGVEIGDPTCPACEEPNPAEARFCRHCGAALAE